LLYPAARLTFTLSVFLQLCFFLFFLREEEILGTSCTSSTRFVIIIKGLIKHLILLMLILLIEVIIGCISDCSGCCWGGSRGTFLLQDQGLSSLWILQNLIWLNAFILNNELVAKILILLNYLISKSNSSLFSLLGCLEYLVI